jgi:hypothetical protein
VLCVSTKACLSHTQEKTAQSGTSAMLVPQASGLQKERWLPMCKHEEIVLASRNAVVGVRAALVPVWLGNLRYGEELSRRENAYDALLEDLDKECKSCITDFEEANHACFKEVCDCYAGRDFLRFVDDFVTHFRGGKCEVC